MLFPRLRVNVRKHAFFRFAPPVSEDRDEYQSLLKGAKRLASTELYVLKQNHIALLSDPKLLLVTVRNGKTGFRVANSMSGAISTFSTSPKTPAAPAWSRLSPSMPSTCRARAKWRRTCRALARSRVGDC